MKEPDAVWQQMTVRQLPAGADRRCSPKLDLMPIRHPLDADIRERHPNPMNTTRRPGAVLDHYRLSLGPSDLFRQYAGHEINETARRKRNNDLDRSRGLSSPDFDLGERHQVEAAGGPARISLTG
jgi:hypothetical protein